MGNIVGSAGAAASRGVSAASLVGSDDGAAAAGQKSRDLAQRWQEINGQKNWVGLLEPHDHVLDETLREEIIRYGEFAQSTYDAFDCDSYSKYCGSCRYSKKKLLDTVGLPNRGYEVTRYLYATEDFDSPLKMLKHSNQPADSVWSTVSNWIGFVAVCTDEKELRRLGRRDILVAWRGTVTDLEWLSDIEDVLAAPKRGRPAISLTDDIKVDAGFWSLYNSTKSDSRYNQTSVREQVNKEVLRLLDVYKNETDKLSITITGHSLGAALAVLNAYDIAQELQSSKNLKPTTPSACCTIPMITVFSFAGPRVGNDAFRKRFESELGIKALRMVNVNDLVPKVPGVFVNEQSPELSDLLAMLPWTYSHVGQELKLNDRDSHSLDPAKATIAHRHNLEQYLHLVDGYGRYAEHPPHRDITLVNKGCDFLKSVHFIPAQWRQVQNKGLVRNADGTWSQAPRELEDIPTPPTKV